MKKVIVIQILSILIWVLLLSSFDTRQNALSYFYGSSIVLVNLLLQGFAWSRMFRKKFVALALFVIIFKYAFLGAIIYKILRLPWMDSKGTLWFCAGVSSLLFSSVIFALTKEKDVI